MDASQSLSPLKKVKYSDLWVRFGISLIGAYIVGSIGKWSSFSDLMYDSKFWKVAGTSGIFAIGLISLIRQSYLWLDKRFTWERDTLIRLMLQFLISWLVPFILAFLFASFFQYKKGTPISENGWFARYGLTDGLLLAAVNVYYIFWYIVVSQGLFKEKEIVTEPELITDPILFITNINEIKIAQRKTGTEVIQDKRALIRIFEDLPPHEYLIFGRSSIIRLDNIRTAEELPDRGAYAIMKYPIGKKIYVSERQKDKLQGFFSKKE